MDAGDLQVTKMRVCNVMARATREPNDLASLSLSSIIMMTKHKSAKSVGPPIVGGKKGRTSKRHTGGESKEKQPKQVHSKRNCSVPRVGKKNHIKL